MKKKIIIVIGVIIAVIVVICSIANLGKLSVKDYINDKIPFYGINGYATVSENDVFDYARLEQDLGQAEIVTLFDEPSDFIDVEFDNNKNLSNGDVVTATIMVNCDSINNFKFDKKLTGKKEYIKKYKVKGLEDAVKIDPFEMVKNIVYDKTDNTCHFDMDTAYNKDFNGYSARYYDNGDLQIVDSQGEKIAVVHYEYDEGAFESTKKITISTDCKQDSYSEKGIIIDPVSKEIEPITCDFLTKGSELSEKDFNTLKNRAITEFNEVHPDSKYIKAYFGYDKSGNGNGSFWTSGHYNQIKYLFSYSENDNMVYQCLSFYDVKLISDGALLNPENLESSIGTGSVSIEELENDQKENWQVFSSL